LRRCGDFDGAASAAAKGAAAVAAAAAAAASSAPRRAATVPFLARRFLGGNSLGSAGTLRVLCGLLGGIVQMWTGYEAMKDVDGFIAIDEIWHGEIFFLRGVWYNFYRHKHGFNRYHYFFHVT
jgi:hypothetical protein